MNWAIFGVSIGSLAVGVAVLVGNIIICKRLKASSRKEDQSELSVYGGLLSGISPGGGNMESV
jgi:hypothetical protein